MDNILIGLAVGLPMLGSVVCYLIGRRSKPGRNAAACAVAAIQLLVMFTLLGTADGNLVTYGLCGVEMAFQADGFRCLYAVIAAVMWLMTTLFSPQYMAHYRNRNRYYLFWLLTLSATTGVFLSADLMTTFIFFEIMSFASYIWVVHDETPDAKKAAETYLAVAVLGGMVLLYGLFSLYNQAGTLRFDELYTACSAIEDKTQLYIAAACLLFGFGAKAGMFPLHIWLPKAHPIAPAPASALLSGILTKSGVFGILVTTTYILRYDQRWGMLVLCFGVVTMLLGAILALFSVHFKRTLACSSMSQIGFILVGVGMMALLGHENALAVRGTTLHMVNHSLIKLTLFMVAGVCYMNTHKLHLNDLRGYGRGKPMLMFWYVCGAWSIMGLPLGSGYVSKTLLHESIVEYIHELAHHGANTTIFNTIEWLFLIAGGMTIAYMTKLFVVLFVDKPAGDAHHGSANYANSLSRVAITVSALILPVLGLLPYYTMNPIASFAQGFLAGSDPAHAVAYYSWTNLKGAVISIVIGMVIYFGFVRTVTMKRQSDGSYCYVDRWPRWLDLEDGLYRPLCKLLVMLGALVGQLLDRVIDGPIGQAVFFVGAVAARVLDRTVDGILVLVRRTLFRERHEHDELVSGTRTTYAMGRLADGVVNAYNRITHHTRAGRRSFVEIFARWHDEISDENSIIARSMSFGLLMAGLGVFLTMVYLLIYVLFPNWTFMP